ncbi:MAG: hypothetical protein EAZ24_11615, partial [Burkholderiales bacterium]
MTLNFSTQITLISRIGADYWKIPFQRVATHGIAILCRNGGAKPIPFFYENWRPPNQCKSAKS